VSDVSGLNLIVDSTIFLVLTKAIFVFLDFVVLGFVSSVPSKSLSGKSTSEMTYFMLSRI